ncbi:hypothetical protein DFH28DRAFT_81962 [Melampsora americana]|nr:hypothetical protein DFH28DRAFT_81962 [Melampsora americana]
MNKFKLKDYHLLKSSNHHQTFHPIRRTYSTSNQPINHSSLNPKPELNQSIKEAIKQLPDRPPRLDSLNSNHHQYDQNLINSLNRSHTPVGSSYSKAKSPVYFPNISLKLVRPSSTDKSDPYTAIFHSDLRLTKPDIYNYLRQVYGLGITSIRTAIYRGRYIRKLKSKVTGGLLRSRDKNRTFKKIWIGMNLPFFFPSFKSLKWLEDHYLYSDSLNAYQRSKAQSIKLAETDPRSVLPSGMNQKGERENVLMELFQSKKSSEKELKRSIRKSLSKED